MVTIIMYVSNDNLEILKHYLIFLENASNYMIYNLQMLFQLKALIWSSYCLCRLAVVVLLMHLRKWLLLPEAKLEVIS